jgi:hypothetical protein
LGGNPLGTTTTMRFGTPRAISRDATSWLTAITRSMRRTCHHSLSGKVRVRTWRVKIAAAARPAWSRAHTTPLRSRDECAFTMSAPHAAAAVAIARPQAATRSSGRSTGAIPTARRPSSSTEPATQAAPTRWPSASWPLARSRMTRVCPEACPSPAT